MVAVAVAAVVAVPLSIAALFQGVKHFAEREDEVEEDYGLRGL
jgi:hypothetical protein